MEEKKQQKEDLREVMREVIKEELGKRVSMERYPERYSTGGGEPWEEMIDTGRYAPQPPHGGRNPDLLHGLCFKRLYEEIQELRNLLQK